MSEPTKKCRVCGTPHPLSYYPPSRRQRYDWIDRPCSNAERNRHGAKQGQTPAKTTKRRRRT